MRPRFNLELLLHGCVVVLVEVDGLANIEVSGLHEKGCVDELLDKDPDLVTCFGRQDYISLSDDGVFEA